MKKLLIIGGSPRPNGVSEELIRQVKPYFIDCKIVEYNTYKLALSALYRLPLLRAACGLRQQRSGYFF